MTERLSDERLDELLGPELSVIKYAEVYLLAKEVRAARAREAGLAAVLGPSPINGKWVCGKCAREVSRGYDDGQIEEHHRTCPKRGSRDADAPGDGSTT